MMNLPGAPAWIRRRLCVSRKITTRVWQLRSKGPLPGIPSRSWLPLRMASTAIDMQVKINWRGNPGIGAYSQAANYRAEAYRKAFYNDSFKLQVLFPLNLPQQQPRSKNAPYDVTESRLDNTFFNSWDSIKNNVILHRADVTGGKAGLALLTDHTTSYLHGKDYPLGFTLQYIGKALWGRDYKTGGPTGSKICYCAAQREMGRRRRYKRRNKMVRAAYRDAFYRRKRFFFTPIAGRTLANTGADDGRQRPAGKVLQCRRRQPVRRISISMVKLKKPCWSGWTGRHWKSCQPGRWPEKTVIRLSMPRFGIRTIRLKNVTVNIKNTI